MSVSRQDGPLAVVFDQGSASPAQIGAGLSRIGPLLSLIAPTESARAMTPMLAHFGAIQQLSDDPERSLQSVRSWGIAGITTFSESTLRTTALLAEGLGLPFATPATVHALTDKFAQRQRLNAAGMPAVRHHLVAALGDWDAAVDAVGLPAVVKPACGEGSRNTFLVQQRGEGGTLVTRLLETEPQLVVEEYLVGRPSLPYGDYVSVECAAVDGVVHPITITGKLPQLPPFREVGQFWSADLPPESAEAVKDLAVQAICALGMQIGLAHVEIKLTSGGPRIIEVNGRLGGLQPDLAARATGLDIIELGGRIALGEKPVIVEAKPDRVYFQYYCPAPVQPCRLMNVTGASDVLRLAGVAGYRQFIRPGSDLTGGVATTILGVILGDAADHASMLAVIDQALGALRYTFATRDGVVEVAARDLPDW